MNKKESLIKDIAQVLLLSVIIVLVLIKLFILPVQITGKSMEPTLNQGTRGFSFIVSANTKINRFDIVVIDIGNKYLVKRLIGMPNETIEYKDNVLYVDGIETKEDFLQDVTTKDFKIQLKDDEYYVLGDNREISKDSRYLGSFGLSQIKAHGIFVIYPFNQFGEK